MIDRINTVEAESKSDKDKNGPTAPLLGHCRRRRARRRGRVGRRKDVGPEDDAVGRERHREARKGVRLGQVPTNDEI